MRRGKAESTPSRPAVATAELQETIFLDKAVEEEGAIGGRGWPGVHATPWERYCAWNGCLWKVSNSNYYSGAKVSHEALISEWLFFSFFTSPVLPYTQTHTNRETHVRSFVLEMALRGTLFS